MTTISCCAECGEEGGVSLKICKACMLVKYCNALCQRNHWSMHKIECKRRAAELCDEALFKDPPAKEECPICFIPMPLTFICCMSLPPATITSVPIYDFAIANEEMEKIDTEEYYECCGKSICRACVHSFIKSGNIGTCPFCKTERNIDGADEERVRQMITRMEANDASAMCELGRYYKNGLRGLQQDQVKAIELMTKAAALGSSRAHFHLGEMLFLRGDLKKGKFHLAAAAMEGHELARYELGGIELNPEFRIVDRAAKHLTIAASAGHYISMHRLRIFFEKGYVSRESINTTLTAYNNSCAEMRSEARDTCIRLMTETIRSTNNT